MNIFKRVYYHALKKIVLKEKTELRIKMKKMISSNIYLKLLHQFRKSRNFYFKRCKTAWKKNITRSKNIKENNVRPYELQSLQHLSKETRSTRLNFFRNIINIFRNDRRIFNKVIWTTSPDFQGLENLFKKNSHF